MKHGYVNGIATVAWTRLFRKAGSRGLFRHWFFLGSTTVTRRSLDCLPLPLDHFRGVEHGYLLRCRSTSIPPCDISPAFSALAAYPSAYTIQTVYSYVWCCSRLCTGLHHQYGYTDISYIKPVTSSLCQQPYLRYPSDADEDGRLCTLGCWSAHLERTSCWHLLCTQSGHL